MLRPLFVLLALPLVAASPDAAQKILTHMESLAASRSGVHPLEARRADEQLRQAARELDKLGEKAVPALKWYAARSERPLSVRLYAVTALGMIGDLRSLPTLKDIVRDDNVDAGLRSAAMQAIGGLRLPARQRWRFLEEAAAEGMPDPLRREALAQLANTPGENSELLEDAAKRFGARPEGSERISAAHAVAALKVSRSPEAEAALFRLLDYYRTGHALRADVLTALSHRRLISGRGRLGRPLSDAEFTTLKNILFEEEGALPLQAARLLGSLAERRAAEPLIRVLKRKQDPALVTAAALSLKAIGDPAGIAAVEALLAALVDDPRFKPAPNKVDPRRYALQIRRAVRADVPRDAAPADASIAGLRPAPAPRLPFAYQGWPGAGRPRPAWRGPGALRLRVKPDAALPVFAEIPLAAGEEIRFADSRVVMSAAGRARASKKIAFDVLGFGAVTAVKKLTYETGGVAGRLEFTEADTIEVLAYRAEGECFLRQDGAVYLGPCPQRLPAFRMLEEPEAQWWLRAELAAGEGWFWADQEGIEFLPRRFEQ